MRDRLIELFRKTNYQNRENGMTANLATQFTDFALKQIVDKLLAEGVIVPPCKVGQTVYVISRYYDGIWQLYKCRVCDFTIYKTNIFMTLDSEDEPNFGLHISEMGKTVFLTKEEAEKALERSENGKS